MIFAHDAELTRTFLTLLWPFGVPDDEVLILSAQRPGEGVHSAQADDLEGIVKLTARSVDAEANVWLNIATRREGVERRGGLTDVLTVPAIWADVDVAEGAPEGIHKGADNVLATYADADAMLAACPVRPTAVVRTGYGYSAWWAFLEPQSAEVAAPLLLALKATLVRLSAGRIDPSVYEVARMMRLPGTWNMKRPESPLPVTFVFADGPRWGVDDLEEALDLPELEVSTRSVTAGATVSGKRSGRPGDDYSDSATTEYVVGLLAGHGAVEIERYVKEDRLIVKMARPGKDAREGASLTVGWAGEGRTHLFSSGWCPPDAPATVPAGHYTAFRLLALLEHGGDWGACTKALGALGFGAKPKKLERTNVMTGGQVGDVAAAALCVAAAADPDMPRLAYMGNALHRLLPMDDGRRISTVPLTTKALDAELGAVIRWVKLDKEGNLVDTVVSVRTMEHALGFAGPDRVLAQLPDGAVAPPLITSVTYAPFLRADGSVCQEAGVDPDTGVFLHPQVELTAPVAVAPTRTDAAASAAWLLEEVLGDFPLASEADRANALAYLLTPGLRVATGLAPIFDLDASTPGSGKGLLTDVVAITWTGKGAGSIMLTGSNDEDRKLITSMFTSGYSVIRFDEVENLRGSALQKLATDTVWSDRFLGGSTVVSYPNVVTWAATGNNKEVKGDMVRRVLRVRFIPREACPWLRNDFRHTDLLEWLTAHRGEAVGHCLTMARAWYAAGCPKAPATPAMGSYGRWATTISGILSWAGVSGFLDNREDVADEDNADVEAFLEAIAAFWVDGAPFTAHEVIKGAEERMTPTLVRLKEAMPTIIRYRAEKAGMSEHKVLGEWLSRHRDRFYGRCRVASVGMVHGGRRTWSVHLAGAPDPAEVEAALAAEPW